nr:unnamed protein product [Callosobruchus analis]
MSLLLSLLDDTAFHYRPSRLLDQHFGSVLDADDLLQPFTIPRLLTRCLAGYTRNWQKDSGSTVTFDNEKFQANLDVQQFKPEEISVKLTGENTITIEGKHEEKPDEHGHICRHFVRRYTVPKNCSMAKIVSQLSSDGVLTMTTPRLDAKQIEHKNIPVVSMGEPANQVEGKK